MTTPVLRYSDAKAGFGVWRNVMVTIFTDQLVEAHIPEINKNHEELLHRYPQGYLGIVIIEPTARAVASELRQRTVDLMIKVNSHNIAGCYVFNGSGVMMTSVRTVVSAMILASRPTRPSKACSDLTEAAEWLAKQNAESQLTKEAYTGAELLEATRELLRRQVARRLQNAAS